MKTDEIEKLLAEVTPGPWLYRPTKYDDWGVVRSGGAFICQAKDPRFLDDDHLNMCRKIRRDPWEANARLIAMAPDLAAEVVRLRAEKEGTYARGFHDAQEKAKVEGRLTIIDSPKLAQMRAILKDCDGALKALGIPEDAEPRASARAALEGRA